MGGVLEYLEYIKGFWTMAKYGLGSISSTFIPYGHQVCKNADGDGLKEVCTIQHIYHKVEPEEHAINVDNLGF